MRSNPHTLYALSVMGIIALPSCFPEFEDQPYVVKQPTLLAVRSTPAELPPSLPMSLDALLATPDGTVAAPLTWAFCTKPRRAEERTGVTAACLEGKALNPIADPAMAMMPSDACFQFGPVSPPTSGEDEQPRRPSDPDGTGGYFVPVRAVYAPDTGEGASAFGFVRVRCDLAGATRDTFDEFQKNYTNNVNPLVGELVLDGTAQLQASVAAGSSVDLALVPADNGAEPYVVYRAFESALFYRAESLSVAWYVTGGTLTRSKQTLTADELGAGPFETTWQAPSQPATVYGWAILRDDRGGVDWRSFELSVQ